MRATRSHKIIQILLVGIVDFSIILCTSNKTNIPKPFRVPFAETFVIFLFLALFTDFGCLGCWGSLFWFYLCFNDSFELIATFFSYC